MNAKYLLAALGLLTGCNASAQELIELFPARYGRAESEMLLWSQQEQARVMALLSWVLTSDQGHLQKVQEIDVWFLSETEPDIFDTGDPRNVLTQARQKFLKLCAALTEQGFAEPEKMTVAAVNAATEYLTARYERG